MKMIKEDKDFISQFTDDYSEENNELVRFFKKTK